MIKTCRSGGFSLIELMIAVVIVGILAAIAVPSYQSHITKTSRAAAQTELLELASLQEKIYLNSNAYTANMTTAYTGNSTGGLNKTSGLTTDGKYTLTIVTPPARPIPSLPRPSRVNHRRAMGISPSAKTASVCGAPPLGSGLGHGTPCLCCLSLAPAKCWLHEAPKIT